MFLGFWEESGEPAVREDRNVTFATSPGASPEEGFAKLQLGPKQPKPESNQLDKTQPHIWKHDCIANGTWLLQLFGLVVQRSCFCEISSAASLVSSSNVLTF